MLRLIFGIFILIISVNGKTKEDLRKVYLEGLGNVLGMKFWDGEYYEFLGIPYATAPYGKDRFQPPLPPKPWDEDMKANRGLLSCQQVYNYDDEGDMIYGETDCLIASYFVPKLANENNLVPVIIYIHNGAYVGGNGNIAKYEFLTRRDVLVVNINYRLGALGFACLGTKEIPGNAALKDIVAALKFIKKHVKSFGGDPDNITLAGYSIGASLAEVVALSKETRGLFNKLILDSGTALAPYAINRHPIETAINIAKSIGYEDEGNLESINEFLLDAEIEELLGASRNLFLKNSTFGFTPCIENPNNPGAVLIESPLETLKRGDYGDFSLIVGYANMEGISRTSQFDEWSKEMNENLANFLPADLTFQNERDREESIKDLKKYYFNDKPLTQDSVREYIDFFSDAMFKYSIIRSLKLHAEHLTKPIYVYEFSYVGKLNTKHQYMDRIRGASHRDATAYVLDFYDWTRNYTDMDMRDLMTQIVADYIEYGNPTPFESDLITVKWLPYKNNNQNYLDMGDKFEMKKNLFAKGFQVWDKIYQKYYWTPTVLDPNPYKGKPKSVKAKPVENKSKVESKPRVEKIDEKSEPEIDRDDGPQRLEKMKAERAREAAAKAASKEAKNKPTLASSEPSTSKETITKDTKSVEAGKTSEIKTANEPIVKDPKPVKAEKKPVSKSTEEPVKKPEPIKQKPTASSETPPNLTKSKRDSKAGDIKEKVPVQNSAESTSSSKTDKPAGKGQPGAKEVKK